MPAVYRLFRTPSADWLKDQNVHEFLDSTLIAVLFALMLGAGLVINAIGLALRARTAWFMSLFLLLCNLLYDVIYGQSFISLASVNSYLLFLVILLVLYGRRFNQASVVSGSLRVGCWGRWPASSANNQLMPEFLGCGPAHFAHIKYALYPLPARYCHAWT